MKLRQTALFLRLWLLVSTLLASPLFPGTLAWSQEKTKIVLLAGNPSHGYGSHEHLAGCRILAEAIEGATENIECEVIPGGWPEDASVLSDAKAIVMYADGGGGHPALRHLDALGKLMDQGIGFSCLHYAVEVPVEPGGKEFLQWLGGYFETHWSVNPHWTASFEAFPDHPVTRGVKPFSANDEWYFHMRFQPEMKGVTPVLSAVPPEDTMRRPDGPHSGNPAVREAVAKRLPQHVAWVYERPATASAKAGRSFGFTGGHFHWNWGREDILRLVANSIVWTTGHEIPAGGLQVIQPNVDTLKTGQDEPVPQNFDPQRVREEFKLTAVQSSATQKSTAGQPQRRQTRRAPAPAEPQPLYASEIVTSATPGHQVQAEVDISGAEQLFLVCTDAGDGFGCDWANWLNPTLIAADGSERDLTEIDWFKADSDWGDVQRGKNVDGGPLLVNSVRFDKGIGTHANSLIGFKLPKGYTRFKVTCGLDQGGVAQNGGSVSSVRFRVYVNMPPKNVAGLDGGASDSGGASRDPENAVAGITMHPEVEATLVAAEPDLLSLTNLDIDHRGRIWVCEVVNYRGHNGKRPEGDRILILEDTDQDGIADVTKVFYQGRDIDSAMGICVLGNKVIVSCSPNIWVFTDEDGDDVPDRKELFFSNTGQPQHDHSAHSFLFGPDGKLYWNFGNTGKAVHDAAGNIVVDKAGNQVIDNGRPYYGGMPFRCNLDGSEFEVLAHNFRNNYEVTVDSFGALWQSDNDDDGNRATRINYVMEYGNYGYLDELTGAGWGAPRTNMEATIPERHWHLNDPGVAPTMLITGAGSPTGITVYEGELLPEVFRNQIIHCDAGPNVVRAYPVTSYGAGYSATIENLMLGERDRWFRPADVCTAPDGSLFVTDWYDPGVGGHQMVDTERGRLFRIAPPNTKYVIPEFDFATAAGATAALKNPNQSVRYLAWQALQAMGEAARSELETLATDSNPRLRARALWALGKLPVNTNANRQLAVASALSDSNPDVRMMGIRLARQLNMHDFVPKVISDPSPAVRRELAVALRENQSERMPLMWAALAAQHDDVDRWYLEALGVAAEGRWEACFDEYVKLMQDASRPISQDIVWRARCERALPYIADTLSDPSTSRTNALRMLRALDYHPAEARAGTLRQVAETLQQAGASEPSDWMLVEVVWRLPDARPVSAKQPAVVAAIQRIFQQANRETQLELLSKLTVPDATAHLVRLATTENVDSTSVGACELLLANQTLQPLMQLLRTDNAVQAQRVARVIAACRPNNAFIPLQQILQDEAVPAEARVTAAKGLAGNERGARWLLSRATEGGLYSEARFVVGSTLRSSDKADIREQALQLFPAPTMKSKEPLPELSELVKMNGDAQVGATLFKTTGTCANCHVLASEGKNVGPDLSEIGSKLAKEALYISILDPSAGISHNYESWAALTDSGQVVVGLLISQTDDEVVVKDAEGIERRMPRSEIEELKKMDKSLMPENIIENLSTADLVNLVEFLTTLKKKS